MEKQKVNTQKPLIIAYKECRDNIIKSINESGLPSFLLESILNQLLAEVHENARIEYESADKIYRNNLYEKEDGEFIVVGPDEVNVKE